MNEEEIRTPDEGKESETENSELNLQPESENPEQPAETQPVPEPEQPKTDYEKLYKESSREALILREKVKAQESRRELTNEPTATELKAAFPSWEFMSETEKELARGQAKTQKTANAALAAQQQREEQEKWNNQLEFAISANPDLSGKEREFKEFASKPTHRGAPVEVLVDAFLHKATSTPTLKKNPTPILQTGTGGPKESVKPKKISIEEASVIRKNDYKRYKYLVDNDLIEELE